MTNDTNLWLHHPDHGELPARVLVDCVFALAPNGRLLHFHKEQVDIEDRDGAQHYTLTGTDALPERSRCQMIPPFVTAFGDRS